MSKLPLETERLILRDFRPEDFEAFYETSNDPEHQKFYPKSEISRAFREEIFRGILADVGKPDRIKFQLAICLQTGELIGTCGVRVESQEHRQASFGCGIDRKFWGQGYAFEASHRILDFGFSSLQIHRLYAETISENVKARALAERLGMMLEAELKQTKFFQDRWWNTAIYAILEDEWKR